MTLHGYLLASVILCALAATISCGDDDDGAPTAPATDTTAPDTGTPTTRASVAPSATAVPLAKGVFTPVGDLGEPRSLQTAARLPDGRVLVMGGNRSGTSSFPLLASTEAYNPATRTFEKGPDLNTARQTFAAVTLADGRVLAAGGVAPAGTILRSAELYDSVTLAWKVVGELVEARAAQAMVALKDGRVLVVGGRGAGGNALASTEFFDPAKLAFSAGPLLARANESPEAVLLPNGSVLVAGDGTAQIYDPTNNSFAMVDGGTDLPDVPLALSDGRVLLTGGIDHELARTLPAPPTNSDRSVPATKTSVILDPASGALTPVGPMHDARMLHETVLLADGRVLIAGGVPDSHFDGGALASAEIFDPRTATFSTTGSMARGRVWFTLTLLRDGDVLAVGSGSDPPGVTAEVYHP
jgi:hypothetical protein